MKSPWRKTAVRWAELALRLALGGVFGYAGIVKLAAPAPFAESIHGLQIVPLLLINSTALALPIFEILLGAALIAGWRLREMAFAASLLSAVFFGVLLQARLRGLSTDCGCFGPDAWPMVRAVPPLLRDGVLVAAACFMRYRAI